MSERQPYSRVYWSFLHDDKYRKARALIEERCKPRDWPREVAAFRGTWLMLLVQHDQAYPAPGILPASLHKSSLDLLIQVGFVRSLGGDAYEMSGLEAERNRRADSARRGPKGDHDSPPPKPKPVPNVPQPGPKGDPVEPQAEPSRDEDETSPDAPTRAPDPAAIYWNLTGRYPRDKALSWIDDLASSYGPEPVIRALAQTHQDDGSVNTLLGRTEDVLRSEARTLTLKEQATVRSQLKERRAEPPPDPEAVRAELEKILRGEAA